MHFTQKIFYFVLFLLSSNSFGTDCNSDCRKNCETTYTVNLGFRKVTKTATDPFCHARCIAEKELACATGITSCDMWRSNPQTVAGYRATIELIQRANRQDWRPQDEHDCQMWVDQAASLGTAAGAAKTAYSAYQNGVRAALAVNKASVISYIVSEGAKHFMHCACSAASYVESGSSGGATAVPTNDHYYISRVRKSDSSWAEKHGAAGNRNSLRQDVTNLIGNGSAYLERSGYVSSRGPTLTEVICDDRARFALGNGGESMTAVFKEVKKDGWDRCLFKMSNTHFRRTQDVPIFDRYFINLRSNQGGRWSLRKGATSRQATLDRDAKNLLNAPESARSSAKYSSTRTTRATVQCHKDGRNHHFESVGKGDASLIKVLAKVNGKGFGGCTFSVDDIGFSNFDSALDNNRDD